MAESAFSKAVREAGSGLRIPVMGMVNSDPGAAAVLSKLVSPTLKPNYNNKGDREHIQPNMSMFKQLSEKTAQNVSDARTVMQTLPDMELAAQILISSILSPKDMVNVEIIYAVTEGLIAPEVTAQLIKFCSDHFETAYKIKPLLAQWLRDILFETGSYPIAVIPENAIDEAINGPAKPSMESLSTSVNSNGSIKPIGLLGPVNPRSDRLRQQRETAGISLEEFSTYDPVLNYDTTITLESQDFDRPVETFITVTDNFDALKMPLVRKRLREERILDRIAGNAMNTLRHGIEAYDPNIPKGNGVDVGVFGQSGKKTPNVTDRHLAGVIYKERNFSYKPIASLKTQDQLGRRTVGNPLVLHLPTESVIPVYVPGNMSEQVGFFVLIDGDGNPISKADNADYYAQLSSQLNSNGNFASSMLTRVKSMMGGFDINNREHLDYSAHAYGNMIEQDLMARLKHGMYGNGVALAKKEEIYRIMFSRSLAKQHTQLLFIPVELMTYFAFRYGQSGIGESLLENMKILNSLRSMLLFSNVMASLKNSIGRTEVKLKLDPDDPDPQKTIEIAMHEIIRSRQHYFPLGMNSPTDLVDWLQKAGFEFTYEGHPGIPDTSIQFGEKNTQYVKPDTELEDSLRKRAIMAIGVPPESVDAAFNPEFATTVIRNNIMMTKRVTQIQDVFAPQLSEHLRKYMMNSEVIVSGLREILYNNHDKLKKEDVDIHRDLDGDSRKQQVATDPEQQKDIVVSQFLKAFINSFTAALPRPNSVTLENQMAELDIFTNALDKTLTAYIDSTFITSETAGEIAGDVDVLKATLKAHFIRQFLNENGIMQELTILTARGEDGEPEMNLAEVQAEHLNGLNKMLVGFVNLIQKNREERDKEIKDLGVTVGGTSTPADSGSGFDNSSGGDNNGGGGDEFNFGGSSSDTDFGGEPPLDDFGGGSSSNDTGSDTGGNNDNGGSGNNDEETPAEPSSTTSGEPKEPGKNENDEDEEDKDKDKGKDKDDNKPSTGSGAETPSA